MENLVGEIITSIYLDDNNTSIVFATELGKSFPFHAEGDCCSESWFSDIIGIHDLLGNLVVEVEEKEEKEVEATRQEQDILYGYTLKTVQGRCDINFRNSSNGYYGGSCYSGAVTDFDYATLPDSYRKITEDFHS